MHRLPVSRREQGPAPAVKETWALKRVYFDSHFPEMEIEALPNFMQLARVWQWGDGVGGRERKS